jgi:hypothetical protein
VPFELGGDECADTERGDEYSTDEVDPPQNSRSGRTDALEKEVPARVRNRSSRDKQEDERTNC